MAVLNHVIECAEQLGEAKGVRLVEIHQRCVNPELCRRHGQRQRLLHTVDEDSPTIGIARVVGLTHASDEIEDSAVKGMASRRSEEEHVSSGNERRGQGRIVGVWLVDLKAFVQER